MHRGHGRETSDRVLPITRLVAGALAPVLGVAFIILFFEARDTGEHFAWTIRPPMTAVLMGSGYLGGAYYFLRMATGTRWHQTGVALPAVAVFATVMLLATLLHWDRFNHGHLAFWLWLFLYIVAPPLVLGLWLLNRGQDPRRPDPGDAETPASGRVALVALAGASLAIAAILFARPGEWSGWWPWALSPLTARVVSGWFVLAGTASALLAWDRRAATWRIPLEATFVWAGALALGALRYRSSFDGDGERLVFLVANGIWILGFGTLYLVLRSRRPGPGG